MDYQYYIYLIVLSIVLAAGLIRARKLRPAFRVLVVLVAATIASEIIARHYAYVQHNNAPVYHFYVLISFWLYSFIFQLLFQKGRERLIVIFITIPFSIFSIINSLVIQGLTTYPSYSIVASNVLIVLYCLFFFGRLLEIKAKEPVIRKSYFWFNIAVLFFFSLQLVNWGMFNYLLKKGDDLMILVNFGFAVDMVYYIMLGVVLLLDDNQPLFPKSLT